MTQQTTPPTKAPATTPTQKASSAPTPTKSSAPAAQRFEGPSVDTQQAVDQAGLLSPGGTAPACLPDVR